MLLLPSSPSLFFAASSAGAAPCKLPSSSPRPSFALLFSLLALMIAHGCCIPLIGAADADTADDVEGTSDSADILLESPVLLPPPSSNRQTRSLASGRWQLRPGKRSAAAFIPNTAFLMVDGRPTNLMMRRPVGIGRVLLPARIAEYRRNWGW